MSSKKVEFDSSIKISNGIKPPKPGRVWGFIDSEGYQQGMFRMSEMKEMFEDGYFTENTMITSEGADGKFIPLNLAYPNIELAFLKNYRVTPKKRCDGDFADTMEEAITPRDIVRFLCGRVWTNATGANIMFDSTNSQVLNMLDGCRPVISKYELRLTGGIDKRLLSGSSLPHFAYINCVVSYGRTTVFPIVDGDNLYLHSYSRVSDCIVARSALTATIKRLIPNVTDLVDMTTIPPAILFSLNRGKMDEQSVFGGAGKNRSRESMNVIERSDINHGKDLYHEFIVNRYGWEFTDWSKNEVTTIRFKDNGKVDGIKDGRWSVRSGGSFALYQQRSTEWKSLHRVQLKDHILVEFDNKKVHMYLLRDNSNGLIYMQEEMAYFKVVNESEVKLVNIFDKPAHSAVRKDV